MTLVISGFWMKKYLAKTYFKKIDWRTNDVAVLPSGKTAAGLTFYYITKSIIEDDGNVKEFTIKQTRTDTFEVKYVSATQLSLLQIEKIKEAIILYLEPNLKFSFLRKTV
jgi:phenylacetate-CoA ligase